MFLFEFIQEPLGCHQKDDDALQKGNHLRIQIRRTGHDLCTDPQVRDEKRGQRNEYRVLIGQHVDKKTVPHIVHLALPVETLVHNDHLNGAAHTGEDTAHELCQQDDLPGLDTGCLGEFRVDTGDTHLITEGSLLHQHHNENNGCDEDEETVVHARSLDQVAQLGILGELGAAPASASLQEESTDDGQAQIVEHRVEHDGKYRRVYFGKFIDQHRQHGNESACDGCCHDEYKLV